MLLSQSVTNYHFLTAARGTIRIRRRRLEVGGRRGEVDARGVVAWGFGGGSDPAMGQGFCVLGA